MVQKTYIQLVKRKAELHKMVLSDELFAELSKITKMLIDFDKAMMPNKRCVGNYGNYKTKL